MKPQLTPETQALLSELFLAAINTPREKADVFVEYAAHINGVRVQTHKGGWTTASIPDERSLDGTPDFKLDWYCCTGDLDINDWISAHLTRIRAL